MATCTSWNPRVDARVTLLCAPRPVRPGERGADLGEDRGREVGQRGGVPELQEEHAVLGTETSRHGPGRLSRTAKHPVNLGVASGRVGVEVDYRENGPWNMCEKG